MKTSLAFLGVLALNGLIIFYACNKQPAQDKIETIFESTDLKKFQNKLYNPMLYDYTIRSQRVGYDHPSLASLKANSQFASMISRYNLDISNIIKNTYYNSSVEIINIPIRSTRNFLHIYTYQKRYGFALGLEKDSLGFKHVQIADATQPTSVYYEVSISPQNTFGKFRSYRVLPLDNLFQDEPRGVTGFDEDFIDVNDPQTVKGCCQRPFNNCMSCFMSSCSSEWQCAFYCGMASPLCVSSWAIACATKRGCNYPGGFRNDETLDTIPKLPVDTTLVLIPV